MDVKHISHIYWRSIKRGKTDFKTDVAKNDKTHVVDLAEEIRWIARQDVESGIISEIRYKALIGEEYEPAETYSDIDI